MSSFFDAVVDRKTKDPLTDLAAVGRANPVGVGDTSRASALRVGRAGIAGGEGILLNGLLEDLGNVEPQERVSWAGLER